MRASTREAGSSGEQHALARGAAGQGHHGLVDLDQAGLERIGAVEQGRAERGGGGEGVQRRGHGRGARGDGHRRRRLGGQLLHRQPFGHRLLAAQAQQQLLVAEPGDLHPSAGLGTETGLGRTAAAGRGQRGVDRLAGLAFAVEAAGDPGLVAPGAVEADQAARGGDHGGRLGQGVDQGVQAVVGGQPAARLAAGEGVDAGEGHAGHADQQQHAGRGGRAGLERRIGHRANRQQEEGRGHDQQRVDLASRLVDPGFDGSHPLEPHRAKALFT
jgi:hypothetical protein